MAFPSRTAPCCRATSTRPAFRTRPFVTEIGVFPKLDSQYDEIYDEITLAISDLVKDSRTRTTPARQDLRSLIALI